MNEPEFQTGQIKAIECYKEGWAIIKDDYWLMFAIALVGGLIGGMTLYVLLGAMICGIFICFLQKIDTGKVDFDNLWKGFSHFLPSFLVMLVIVVPLILVYGIIYLPIVLAAVMGQNLSEGELLSIILAGAAVDVVIIVVMVCFHTLLMFSFPLIADRNLSAWPAIKTSARAVWQNLGGVGALLGIQFLMTILATVLTCGIGIYFLMPVMLAGLAVGYRRVFPALNPKNLTPPPPDAFGGAGYLR